MKSVCYHDVPLHHKSACGLKILILTSLAWKMFFICEGFYSKPWIVVYTLACSFQVLEEFSAAPFSGEDSFSQFTSEMVRLMKEEEVRAKHQAGLLRLREKALKEKTRAEMDWLECQKQRHRDKGADDIMPSIRKRQRGVLMRLQAEQVGAFGQVSHSVVVI